MDKDIEAFVSDCKTCQENQRLLRSNEPYPWPAPDYPFQRVHIDHAGPLDNKLLLIMVDAFLKWIEVKVVNSTSFAETIRVLRQPFATFGIHEAVVSDKATGFKSVEFADFMGANGIQFITSLSFHPSSNGRAELAVQSAKSSLKKIIAETKSFNDWNLAKSKFLLTQHTTNTYVDGKSPDELLMNRKLRTCLDSIKSKVHHPVELLDPKLECSVRMI